MGASTPGDARETASPRGLQEGDCLIGLDAMAPQGLEGQRRCPSVTLRSGRGEGGGGTKQRPMRCVTSRALVINPRQRPTLPRTYARSTIGGSRLNFRVRNGNGCDPAPMTTGKLFANLEDRTLRCPDDFPGAGSSNAPNSATSRLGVHLRLPRRSAEGEGGSSQNMSVEYSAMSATLTSWDLAAEAFALRTRRAPYPLRDVPVARVFRPANR